MYVCCPTLTPLLTAWQESALDLTELEDALVLVKQKKMKMQSPPDFLQQVDDELDKGNGLQQPDTSSFYCSHSACLVWVCLCECRYACGCACASVNVGMPVGMWVCLWMWVWMWVCLFRCGCACVTVGMAVDVHVPV